MATILPLGAFIFAPAVAAVAYHFAAPVSLGFGVVAAVVAFVVAFYLWPLVAFVLCLPFMPSSRKPPSDHHTPDT